MKRRAPYASRRNKRAITFNLVEFAKRAKAGTLSARDRERHQAAFGCQPEEFVDKYAPKEPSS